MILEYWRQPDVTVETFRNFWFHTGDLAYIDADGLLNWTDRKKDAMRRRGEMISSIVVENAATAYELDEFVYEEIEIEVYGTTAVLSSRYREVARLGEQDLGGDFLVTDVWVRRDGRWQVVRRHATRTG